MIKQPNKVRKNILIRLHFLVVLIFLFSFNATIAVGIDPCLSLPAFPSLDAVPITNGTIEKEVTIARKAACDTQKNTKAVVNKTIGIQNINLFGYNIPIPQSLTAISSWDGLRKLVIKQVIKKLTSDTVKWINNGFDGGPAYVVDPKGYFKKLADDTVGDFIAGSDLDFLCSPFQTNIRVALAQDYGAENSYQKQSSCTFTGVTNNVESFVEDFDKGGWDSWFQMTQNNANNPYGAYIEARVEMDKRILDRLGIKQQELSWNKGFLSFKGDCAKYGNPQIDSETDLEIPDSAPCLEEGPTKTPGSIIEGQLQPLLGQGVTDLGLARSFDDVVSALVTALTNKIFSSASNLFNGKSASEQTNFADSGPLNPDDPILTGGGGGTISNCFADISSTTVNEPVTWSINDTSSSNATNLYMWSGDEIAHASTYDTETTYATGSNIFISYTSEGSKNARVQMFTPTDDTVGEPIDCTPITITP